MSSVLEKHLFKTRLVKSNTNSLKNFFYSGFHNGTKEVSFIKAKKHHDLYKCKMFCESFAEFDLIFEDFAVKRRLGKRYKLTGENNLLVDIETKELFNFYNPFNTWDENKYDICRNDF